jgi:hypothetical protein
VQLADPDQAHPLVVHVTRLGNRRPESLGDADHDMLGRYALGNALAGPEAVLERHHDGLGLQQRRDRERGAVDVGRLRGDHPDIGRPRIRREPTDVEILDDEAAARARDREPVALDRVEVALPDVDRPHLVAGSREEAGVHRAHRTGADNGDLHPPWTMLVGCCICPPGTSRFPPR